MQYYEAFADQNRGDTTSRQETARAYRRVGDIQAALGQHRQAEDAYRQSIRSYRELSSAAPEEPEFLHGIASSTNSLGHSLQAQARLDEAEQAHRQAMESESRLLSRFPDQLEYREEHARILNNLGVLLVTIQRNEEAEEALLAARDEWQWLADESEAPSAYHHRVATSHVNLANLWLEMDRKQQAKLALTQAIEIARSLTLASNQPAYQEQLARSLNSIGVLSMRAKESAEAEAAFREAFPIWEALAMTYGSVPEYREELVRTSKNLAELFGDQADAVPWLHLARDSLRLLNTHFPENRDYRQQLAETDQRLSERFLADGQLDEALDASLQASNRWMHLVEDFPAVAEYQRQLTAAYNVLGTIQSKLGFADEAKAAYHNALGVLDKMPPDQCELPGHRGRGCEDLPQPRTSVGHGSVDHSEQFLGAAIRCLLVSVRTFRRNPSYQHASLPVTRRWEICCSRRVGRNRRESNTVRLCRYANRWRIGFPTSPHCRTAWPVFLRAVPTRTFAIRIGH